MRTARSIFAIGALTLAALGALGAFHWVVNRVYVPPGYSLQLRYKGPFLLSAKKAGDEQLAAEGEVGVLERLRGPGRHFYCPIWWERKVVKDLIVAPGEVAIVTSKLGDPLPASEFLVDGELDGANRVRHKGVLRKVYGPGRYRINTYAYEARVEKHVEEIGELRKYSGWVDIPTGYVGVVTYLADNPVLNKKRGIQADVLPPGIYPINPREQQLDIVLVGYFETTVQVQKKKQVNGTVLHDESGEPLAAAGTGINFPSNDGFDIQLDYTAIWGVLPEDAPRVVQTFGNIKQVEQKVILPQIESICRNVGSSKGAVELLVGETREQFQVAASDELAKVLEDKHLSLLYGLVRHIYIPQDVRLPIQEGYIADELTLTRQQETITATAEADLREAEKKVELERQKVRVETEKLLAETIAEGEREAKEIEAQTGRQVAEIDKKTAILESQTKVMIGQAMAAAQQAQQEAKAQKFQLAVDAFGGADAYNRYQFALGLPDVIDMRLFYAGPGTLWTDLKGVMPTLPLPVTTEQPAPTKPAKK